MSYDIILIRPRPGEDPLITARHEGDEYKDEKPDIDHAKESLKLKVAEALIKANPLLERFLFDFDEIARAKNISLEEAKLLFRNIELNSPDDGNGVQIELFDDEFFATVPYWHDGAKAKSTFQEIWEYLKIIQRESGFAAYDPQLDIILDLSQGYFKSLSVYTGTRQTVLEQSPDIVLGKENILPKKWWQFWK